MENFQQLRKEAWDVFANVPNEKQQFISKKRTLLKTETAPIAQFSEFDENHLARAKAIWTKLFDIANGNDSAAPDDSVETETVRIGKAIDYIRALDENPELKEYAFMVFVTHNEIAKRILSNTIPSILVRKPLKALPSEMKDNKMKRFKVAGPNQSTNDHAESRLNYLREDPLYNEHHEHWHVVYPNGGIPVTDEKGNVTYKQRERHGEMFIYMHQQMLAHYDAHRLAAGLEKVEPYDFSNNVALGYDPGIFVNQFGDLKYSTRPDDWGILSLPYIKLEDQQLFIARLHTAMEQGFVTYNDAKIRLTPDIIGLLTEALGGTVGNMKEIKKFYGNVHNMGHMLLSNSPGVPKPYGVMSQTATAIRDSIFYRWHRHIDNYSFTWQQQQKALDFSDAPNIVIRNGFDYSPDIIICPLKSISEAGKALGLSAEALGQECFGGDNWGKDFNSGSFTVVSGTDPSKSATLETTATIENYMEEGRINVGKDDAGKPINVAYDYLNHEQYGFYFRMENKLPVTSKVTLRVFMVPKLHSEDRRMWMELDKFTHELQPNAKETVYRRDLDAAIIRKPAITNPSVENIVYRPLAVTDMEGFYSQDTEGYLATLNKLVVESEDPDNDPSLVTFYNRYIVSPSGAPLPKDVRYSAFRSLLSKYFNNLTIGWEELLKIENTVFRTDAAAVNTLFNVARHEQALDDVIAYYEAVTDFIKAQAILIEKFSDTLALQISRALNDAFQRVHEAAYCECGLPYNILYPRGTKEGLDYYLMVMVTDWSKDISSFENCCGSMSYCGTKTNYPDIREMGYPFNRPFPEGVVETITKLDNVAMRPVTFRLTDKG